MHETPPGERQSTDNGPPPASPFPPIPEGTPFSNRPGPTAGAPGLYPLDLGGILKLTFSLFRFRWRSFIGAALIVMAPLALLQVVVQSVSEDDMTRWYEHVVLVALNGGSDTLALFPWQTFALTIVVGFVFGLGAVLAQAAITQLTAVTVSGRHTTAGAAVKYALNRLASLAGIYLILTLAVVVVAVVGVLMAAVPILATGGRIGTGPGVFLALILVVATFAVILFVSLRWQLAVTVVVIERRGAIDSLRRSWRLVAGSTWRVLGYAIVLALIVGVIAFVLILIVTVPVTVASLAGNSAFLSAPISPTFNPVAFAVLTIASSLISAGLMPISVIAFTLLYSDLRWRRGEPTLTPGGGSVPE